MARTTADPTLMPGTLDLLILKTLSRTSLHGYGIAQRDGDVARAKLLETVRIAEIYDQAQAIAGALHTTGDDQIDMESALRIACTRHLFLADVGCRNNLQRTLESFQPGEATGECLHQAIAKRLISRISTDVFEFEDRDPLLRRERWPKQPDSHDRTQEG